MACGVRQACRTARGASAPVGRAAASACWTASAARLRARRSIVVDPGLRLELLHDLARLAAELGHRLARACGPPREGASGRARSARPPGSRAARACRCRTSLSSVGKRVRGCQFRADALGYGATRMAGGTGIVLDERMLAHDPGARTSRAAGSAARAAAIAGATPRARGARRRAAGDRGRARPRARPAPCRAGGRDGGTSARSSSIPTRATSARLVRGGAARRGRLDRAVRRGAAPGEVDNGFALVRPPGPSRRARARDGLLPLQQRRRRGRGTARARRRRGSRSSTGTCITATARSTSSRTIPTCSTSRRTSIPFYPGTGAATEVGRGRRRGPHAQRAVPGRLRRRRVRARVRRGDRADLPPVRPGVRAGVGRLRLRRPRSARRARRDARRHRDAWRAPAPTGGGDARAGASSPCSKAATTSTPSSTASRRVLDALAGPTATPPLATGDARRADGVIERVRAAQAPYWRSSVRPSSGDGAVQRRRGVSRLAGCALTWMRAAVPWAAARRQRSGGTSAPARGLDLLDRSATGGAAVSFGSVPATKYSSCAAPPGSARSPLRGSMCTCVTPSAREVDRPAVLRAPSP